MLVLEKNMEKIDAPTLIGSEFDYPVNQIPIPLYFEKKYTFNFVYFHGYNFIILKGRKIFIKNYLSGIFRLLKF